MIVFDLRCSHGHVFEEWFASTADCDTRLDGQGVTCPSCGDTDLSRQLAAPRVNGGAQAPLPPCGRSACGAGYCEVAAGN